MKKFLYTFFLFSAIPSCLFAQGQITQQLEEIWNPDAGTWDFQQVNNWQFDNQNRDILYTHEDAFVNDFTFEDKSSFEQKYDVNGNLILSISRSFSDSTWREYRSEYEYDNQNRLVENQNFQTHSYDPDYLYKNRYTYEYKNIENKIIRRVYNFYVGSNEWNFNNEEISIYDDNDCLLEQEERRYKTTGEITTQQITTWTRDADCRPLTRIFSRKGSNDDEVLLKDKDIYTYSNDGKYKTYTNQRYNETTDIWDMEFMYEIEFDEENRPIRKQEAYLLTELSNEALYLWDYTDEGEQATYHEYRTYKSIGIESLQLTALDSNIYTYNDDAQLILKEQFNDYYYYQATPTLVRKFKHNTKYTYYCNGQLKREIHENLPNIYRATYEYQEGQDCGLSKDDLEIVIFPNPSNGNVEIQSNLLASPNATVQVLSVLGQRVFQQKVAHISNRFSLNLINVPNGNYIISIIDSKTVISKKLYILK